MILSGPGNGRKMKGNCPCLEGPDPRRKVAGAVPQSRDARPPHALKWRPIEGVCGDHHHRDERTQGQAGRAAYRAPRPRPSDPEPGRHLPLQPARNPAHEKAQADPQGSDHQAGEPAAAGHHRLRVSKALLFPSWSCLARPSTNLPAATGSRPIETRGWSPTMTNRGRLWRGSLPPRQIRRVAELFEVL